MKKRDINTYIMRFVDTYYGEHDYLGADDAFGQIVETFKETIETDFSDDTAFGLLLQAIYIPDHYDQNGSKEKLYSKLVEVLVAVWAERMGFESAIPTQKSNREDVRIVSHHKLIVADVKTFRMGRSQPAPNIKDFIKVSSFKQWMQGAQGDDHTVLGGLITYPSSHEWSGQSDVYRLCSLKETPIVMLSYDELALLLSFKDQFDTERFFELWNYPTLFPTDLFGANNKAQYHQMIDGVINDWLRDVIDSPLHEAFVLSQQAFYAYVKQSCMDVIDAYQMKTASDLKHDVKLKSRAELEEENIRLNMILKTAHQQQQKRNILKFR